MWHLVNFSLGSIRVNTSLRALVLPLSTHPLLTANEIGCTDHRGSMVLLVLLLPRLPNVVVAAAALLMLLSEDALQFEALWLRSDPRAPISYLFFCALDGAQWRPCKCGVLRWLTSGFCRIHRAVCRLFAGEHRCYHWCVLLLLSASSFLCTCQQTPDCFYCCSVVFFLILLT